MKSRKTPSHNPFPNDDSKSVLLLFSLQLVAGWGKKAITLPSSQVNHKLQDSNHLNLPRSKQCELLFSPLPAVMTSCNEDHDISNGGRRGGEQIGGSWDKSRGEKCLYS